MIDSCKCSKFWINGLLLHFPNLRQECRKQRIIGIAGRLYSTGLFRSVNVYASRRPPPVLQSTHVIKLCNAKSFPSSIRHQPGSTGPYRGGCVLGGLCTYGSPLRGFCT